MWLKNFFDYYYVSPPGEGMFGYRHWIWIAATIILSTLLYQYSKRKQKPARVWVIILCFALFIIRLTKQIYRAAAGIEDPVYQAIPWELCTLMTFVMPVVAIFNIKKLKPMIYSLSLIGGIITVILGPYFGSAFLTVWEVEGIMAHTLLVFIPMMEMGMGSFRLEFKNTWQTVLGLIICTAWALLADLVLFAKYDTNHSELMHNNLGFDIPGVPYQVVYSIIAVVFITALYGIPTLTRKIMHNTDPRGRR